MCEGLKKEQAFNKLLAEYNKLEYKGKQTALKYYYTYKDVNVNVYFDAYDAPVYSLSLILVHEKCYYYTSLNVSRDRIDKQYLHVIPLELLARIVNDNTLDAFFEDMYNQLLNSRAIVINYKRDHIFINTLRWNKNRKDLPFLWTVRRTRMTDKTLLVLRETMCIDEKVLRELQRNNLTLVRTDDPDKRRSLTLILKGTGILIKL